GSEYPLLQGAFILVSVFGYYGLWPRLLLTYIGYDSADAVSALILLLGLPFLLLGLSALLLWCCRLQQRSAHLPLLLAWCTAVLVALWLLNGEWMVHNRVRQAWSAAGVIFTLFSLVVMGLGGKGFVSAGARLGWLGTTAALGVVFISGLTPLTLLSAYEQAFILLFFLLTATLPVLYVYRAERPQGTKTSGFDAFFERHGISKREAQIIQGIYEGRTNQEIANRLFLSLQTVKDHTSRIYQKTFVKNRGQLTALLRDIL
ncbi:MAG: helix-turn-helix transcriptional regulator, partial [Pseudomonadales bacterium]|nr:helix-turn-helix transcriptional regulator [Pseudomonadales bacterium]